MPNSLLGCYPPTVLLTSGASASGTGTQMLPRDCEKLCLDQQAALRRDNQNGNPNVSFNFFTIKEAANECACAPAMDRTINKLRDSECGGRNSPGVLLYSLTDPASSTAASSAASSRTVTNGASPTNGANSGTGAATDPSSDSSSSSSGSSNVAVITTVSVLALVVALLGAMYMRQRRRNQMLGQVLRSNSLTAGGPSHPPPAAVSPASHNLNALAPPPANKPMSTTTSALVPTAAPPQPAGDAGVVMVPFARSAANQQTAESTSPPSTHMLVPAHPPPPTYPGQQHVSPAMLATSPPGPTPSIAPMDPSTLPIVPTDEVLTYGVRADPHRQYMVYRGYQPALDDELALVLGEGVVLLEVYDDGWALGRVTTQHRQGAPEGVFPVVALMPEVNADGVVELPPETMGRGDTEAAHAVAGENPASRPVRLPGQAPPLPPNEPPHLLGGVAAATALQVNERRSSMMNSPGSLSRRVSASGVHSVGGQDPPHSLHSAAGQR